MYKDTERGRERQREGGREREREYIYILSGGIPMVGQKALGMSVHSRYQTETVRANKHPRRCCLAAQTEAGPAQTTWPS